ncbi:hypothetical protein EVAR_57795_1 [Eumeta japonica]|uniref:Uncharacterized protein n=1 Tax=Eumeta variegata TaxID=151549 RepID=A0A4C1Y932_EUMVA|nr:hypothetical protein EVAR_57795_1 [Eumeta japonica]
MGTGEAISCRTIRVDAMAVSFKIREIVDQLGCIKASEVHEVVVHENQGENLNYLLQRDPIDPQHIAEDKIAMLEESRQRAEKEKSESQGCIDAFLGALERAAKSLLRVKSLHGAGTSGTKAKKSKVPMDPKTVPTRTQKGGVDPAVPVPVRQLRDQYANAFSEFIALTY